MTLTKTQPIIHLCKVDKRLERVICEIGDIEPHDYSEVDGFTFLVREIVGQMISAKVKKTIYNRLLALCHQEVIPSRIDALSIEDLRQIGLSNSKSNYIKNLATLALSGSLELEGLRALPDDQVMETLTSIKGIGQWTSKMYLLFFLGREDVLPFEDGAFIQAYRWLYNTSNVKPKEISKNCKKWSPYSSLASKYLYRALDTGLTTIDIDSFLSKEL
jgi:DNA-3-methyladenine glycosylase II